MARPGNVIGRGSWCPECAGVKKKSIRELQRLAKKKKGRCLSTFYSNAHAKYKWMCENGHTWYAKAADITQGHWCGECSRIGRGSKYTILDMKRLAESKKGKCLSKTFVNTRSKLKWKCEKNHVWMTIPKVILRGFWCPECAGVKRKTIEDMQRAARAKKGQCLSKFYQNQRTKLKWRCKKGHTWHTLPTSVINAGTWCPHCYNERRGKRLSGKKSGQRLGV